MSRRVVWFSCGAASAVAAKVTVEKYGADSCAIVYCDTLSSEHPDNARFFREVEAWVGVPFQTIRSRAYESIDEVFMRTRYMSGIKGARCTVELKKLPREQFQRADDIHIFGYTSDEQRRADTFEANNPAIHVEWVLIDAGIGKEDCLEKLGDAGIKLPEMYTLGFDHNNCLGCVKATSPGYWNRVRKYFPAVFEKRAQQSRLLGVRLTRVKGERLFLDELPPAESGPDDDIECGPVCQTPKDQ